MGLTSVKDIMFSKAPDGVGRSRAGAEGTSVAQLAGDLPRSPCLAVRGALPEGESEHLI